MVRGLLIRQQEDTMRLITRFELASRSRAELHALFRQATLELTRSEANSPERRTALASLETIEAELRSRMPGP